VSDGCYQRLVPRRVGDIAPRPASVQKTRSPALRPERSGNVVGEATVRVTATTPGRGHRDNLSVPHAGAENTPSLICGRGSWRTDARVTEQQVSSSNRAHSKLKATYPAAYGSSKGLP
jgi:hypothetical protein